MSFEHCLTLNTGAKFPLIGYGTWQSDGDELEAALEVALNVGYRHIDTAAFYKNEHIIGNVLSRWFSENKIQREDVFITTKLPTYANRPEYVRECLDESLSKLQLDYVDLYLVHGPFGLQKDMEKDEDGNNLLDLSTDHVAIWQKMEETVDEGKAKAIGLSNFNEAQIQRVLSNARIPPANLQIELHVYLQVPSLVNFCRENNMIVTSYSSLGTKGTYQTTFKDKEPINLMDDELIVNVANKYGKTAAQVLLRFLVQQDIAVIPKSIHENRIKENFEIFDFTLDDEDMENMKSLDRGEAGRILIFKDFFKGLERHPEYPFPL